MPSGRSCTVGSESVMSMVMRPPPRGALVMCKRHRIRGARGPSKGRPRKYECPSASNSSPAGPVWSLPMLARTCRWVRDGRGGLVPAEAAEQLRQPAIGIFGRVQQRHCDALRLLHKAVAQQARGDDCVVMRPDPIRRRFRYSSWTESRSSLAFHSVRNPEHDIGVQDQKQDRQENRREEHKD